MIKKVMEVGWNLDHSYARLPKSFYSKINPTPVNPPELVILNDSLARELGLNPQTLKEPEGVAVLAGNQVPQGAEPVAQAYGGHQFGYFTMLGDGRAVLLGEQITLEGKRVDIQLKGSGRTPYSRGGDGRAVLGPMLREYIISEAMAGLGIPTTRSLAVAKTGQSVMRETALPGAVLTRVASSHIRVGTFQYASVWGKVEELRALADYTLKRHFPEAEADENPYLSLLKEAIKVQAALIAKWQLVGFVHGVMNTDNMTLSGETIDYGPCAFMDTYDPKTVFSSIDTQGRYAYGNQPGIGLWNLARLADALLPLLHTDQEEALQLAQEALAEYEDLYRNNWLTGMAAKLGIFNYEPQDKGLIEGLLGMMEKHRADYTNTFLALTFDRLEETPFFNTQDFHQWHEVWQARLNQQPQSKEQFHQLIKDNNPALIPRNHRVEEALEAAEKRGDYSVMNRLLNALSNPYDHRPDQREYASPPAPSACPYRTFCGT